MTDKGDTHYWGVWHGGKPFSEYLTIKPRFCSEFGFQSFPALEELRPFIDNEAEDFAVKSHQMEFRQRSPTIGNASIMQHIERIFHPPSKGFGSFVYLSQVLQAISIKTAVEHWRRLKPYCMGTLYWQLVRSLHCLPVLPLASISDSCLFVCLLVVNPISCT